MNEVIDMFNPRNWDLGVFGPFAVFVAAIVFIAVVA